MAKAFTRERLSHPFVVRTCEADAMGRSRLPRFYAFVQTENGDLAEQLVENGLARIHGKSARRVDLPTAGAERDKLEELEKKARLEKVGAWGASEGRMIARAARPESARGVDPFDAFFHPEKRPSAGMLSSSPGRAVTSGEGAVRSDTPRPRRSVGSGGSGSHQNKLDINTASAVELENIPGIGAVLAQRIMAARPFKSADDLQNVKGIGAGKRYEQIRPFFR